MQVKNSKTKLLTEFSPKFCLRLKLICLKATLIKLRSYKNWLTAISVR